MRFILLLLFFGWAMATSAQDNSGLYAPIKKSNDPQGGSVFYITNDNHWGAMAFGTAKYGALEKLSDSLYVLSHIKPESPFLIYGRKNKSLADSTKLFFSDFTSGSYLVNFNTGQDTLPKVRKVFSDRANGFSFPYVYTLHRGLDSISLARRFGIGNEVYEFITFKNPNGYNEFIIENHSEQFFERDRIVVIKNAKLYDLGRPQNGYRRLSGVDSTVNEMNNYLKDYFVYPKLVFYSSKYKNLKETDLNEDRWLLDSRENYYYQGEKSEAVRNENKADYNEPIIVYPYKKLGAPTTKNSAAQIVGSPLFKTYMED